MTTPPRHTDFEQLTAWLQEDPQRAAALVLYLSEDQEFERSRGSGVELPPGLRTLVDLYASVRRAHVAHYGEGAEQALGAEEQRLRAMIDEWKRAWRAESAG